MFFTKWLRCEEKRAEKGSQRKVFSQNGSRERSDGRNGSKRSFFHKTAPLVSGMNVKKCNSQNKRVRQIRVCERREHHEGGDLVIQSILAIEMVNGMLFYSSVGAYGKPIMHLGPVAVNNNEEKHNGMEHFKNSFMIYGKRFAVKAAELFG